MCLTIKNNHAIIHLKSEGRKDMKDIFKRETLIGFTAWDINAKCVHSKSRHKDSIIIKRSARHKAKQSLDIYTRYLLRNNQKMLDNFYGM